MGRITLRSLAEGMTQAYAKTRDLMVNVLTGRKTIGEAATEAVENELESFGTITQQTSAEVAEKIANIGPSLKGVAASMQAYFDNMWHGIWTRLQESMPMIGAITNLGISDFVSTLNDLGWEKFAAFLKENNWADDNDIAKFTRIYETLGGDSPLAGTIVMVALIPQFVKQYGYYAAGTMRQTLAKAYTPEVPQPQAILQGMFLAPDTTEDIREAMQRAGFDEHDQDLMIRAMQKTYSPSEAIQLFVRGEIDRNGLYTRMRENGLTDDKTDEAVKLGQRLHDTNVLITLWRRKAIDDTAFIDRLSRLGYSADQADEFLTASAVIPSVQDLMLMLSREAFEPDQVSKFGLMDEYPSSIQEYTQAQGLSDFWTKKYWISHWQQPGFSQVAEMLHRGLIDESDVYEYMRVIEIPTYWREKLVQINYNPYTRVDVRRMHDLGVLTDEQLLKSYMDLGYNFERAENMTEFTKLYNTENERELTKAQVEKLYREGLIERDKAHDYFVALRYKVEQANYFLDYIDATIAGELREAKIKNIHTRFILDEDMDNAKERLRETGITEARMSTLLVAWDYELWGDKRTPTRSDITRFLKKGVITSDEYIRKMKRLGYHEKDTNLYLQEIISDMIEEE